jgi:hypothetical protein
VGHYSVGIEGVNTGGKGQVKFKAVYGRIPPALEMIGGKPPKITEEVRPRKPGNFVPHQCALAFPWIANNIGKVVDTLRVKMNFCSGLGYESFELFRETTLGAMPPVYERGYNRKPQLSALQRAEHYQYLN